MNYPTKVGHWINGSDTPAISGDTFPVIDPGLGKTITSAAMGNQADVDRAIVAAQKAFYSADWCNLPPYQRGRLMLEWARCVQAEQDHLARLLSQENGKPLRHALDEVGTTIRNLEYFAGWADKVHGRVVPIGENVLDYIRREPLGIVGHIIPWNYPLDIFMRGVAPCLAVGNTIVAKPAEETPLSTLELARMATKAGIPDGVVNIVTGGAETGAALASHTGIQALAFCGSIDTGKQILVAAAENITPVVSLELGGKSPCLIFEDADINLASENVAMGICYNTGQSCGALSRVLVHKKIAHQVIDIIKETLSSVSLGYGLDDPGMGPLVSQKQLENVQSYISIGEQEGAVLNFGGKQPRADALQNGYFIEPTVFVEMQSDMRIAEEEIFGPVMGVMVFEDEDQAIEMANDSKYGLSAEIWTRDLSRAHRVAAQLDVSHVTVNGGGGFGVEAPFGGVKQSGFGREGGLESILQYSRVKNIWINL